MSWFWKYDIEPGSEFRARLRLSASTATGPSLVNVAEELNFILAGNATDFENFATTIALPDWANTFDLSFISGGAAAGLGTLYVDDISAALARSATLTADYDQDGDVDGNDLMVWQTSIGSAVAPGTGADGNRDGIIDGSDLAVWRFEMENDAAHSPVILTTLAIVPEPLFPLNSLAICFACLSRLRLRIRSNG